MNEQELKHTLKRWSIEPPADELAERVVRHATARQQVVPLAQYLAAIFSDWRTGLVYKTAGLALCAVIGFGNGYLQQETSTVDLSALAFSDAGFSGDLL